VVDFFNEVEEELRADRVRVLIRKYLPVAVAVIVVLIVAVAGVLGWKSWREHAASKASLAYQHAVESLLKGDKKAAEAGFVESTKAGSAVYKTLGLMQQGGMRLDENKTADAVKLFDEAAKAAPGDILGDQARLAAVYALMDTAPLAEIEKRLEPLLKEKRPYRAYAREALGMAKLQAGQAKDARAEFATLILLSDAPDDMRQRAQVATQMIDSGQAAQLPAVVKSAAALPATPAFNPSAMAGQPAPQAGAVTQ
jgi:hypothetical protein